MNRREIAEQLSRTFQGLDEGIQTDPRFPKPAEFSRGKVRDIIDFGRGMLICTSDRISAFDRILATIPCKGEVLNGMSVFWFEQTADIISNHVQSRVSGRSLAVKKYTVLPVEVVIRGYLTGSSWRDYQKEGKVSGIPLPGGMRFNERFPEPLLTPSTKAEKGTHDVPVSEEEIISRGIVDETLWNEVRKAAFRLFERGSEIAASRGLILVDTKYEFGIDEKGRAVLVDEIHTPDSSRYWFADTYTELFEAGEKQRKIDKEYLRQWLMEQGFMGDGEQPEIPDEIRLNVAEKYIEAYELITGTQFRPEANTPDSEQERVLSYLENTA
jgi:phosphoribosylaminoimidazole-succinocarboxamide synthase